MDYYITSSAEQIRDTLFPELRQRDTIDSIAEHRPLTHLEVRIRNRLLIRELAVRNASVIALRSVAPSPLVFINASDWKRLVLTIDAHYMRLCPSLECEEAFSPVLGQSVIVFRRVDIN